MILNHVLRTRECLCVITKGRLIESIVPYQVHRLIHLIMVVAFILICIIRGFLSIYVF